MIFCFSGTGNSAYVAKRIGEQTGEEIFSINRCFREKKLFVGTDVNRAIFVVPTYAWRIPRIVEEWIRKSTFGDGMQAYFVMTCGSEIGNAGHYVKKLCSDKEFLFMGCAEVVMPENYIALFKTPTKDEAHRIISKAEPMIDQLAAAINAGASIAENKKTLAGRACSGFINEIFYPMFVHAGKFRQKENCIRCGKCVKECPLNNITLEENRIRWGNRCTHCMACISKCPAEAIEYGKHSVGLPRYQCPGK